MLIVLGLNTIGTMLALLLLQHIPGLGQLTNSVPAGPTAIISSILYQYFRLVPEAYHFRIFGITFSDKFWVYGIAFQVSTACLWPVRIHFIIGYNLNMRNAITIIPATISNFDLNFDSWLWDILPQRSYQRLLAGRLDLFIAQTSCN